MKEIQPIKPWRSWMFIGLVVMVSLLLANAPLPAQDWDEIGNGFRLGNLAWVRITEDGATKFQTPINERSAIEPSNPASARALGSDEVWQINLQRTGSYGGAIAFSKSMGEAAWDYWAPGTTKTTPLIIAEWELESKDSAPQGPPLMCAQSDEHLGIYISRILKKHNGQANTNYVCMGSVDFDADFVTNVQPEYFPDMRAYMVAVFGQSSISAKWDPGYNNGGGKFGAWLVHKKIWNTSTHSLDETDEVVKFPLLDKTYSMYAETEGTGNFVMSCRVGPTNRPNDDPVTTGEDQTAMLSRACSSGTTGTSALRDERWLGAIRLRPITSVYKTP